MLGGMIRLCSSEDVYRVAHAALQGRCTSTFEACHLLLGEPVVLFSRDNVWVQTNMPGQWSMPVPRAEEALAIEDPLAYAQGRGKMPALLGHYAMLQRQPPDGDAKLPVEGAKEVVMVPWKKVTFFDFVSAYRVKNDSGTLQMTARNKPAIVGHRTYNPDAETEAFYFAKMLLHSVWIEPGDWLVEEDDGQHVRAFQRHLANDPDFLKSYCFPEMDGTVIAARELAKVQAEMYLRSLVEGPVEQSKYEDGLKILEQLRVKHGGAIDMDIPNHIPSGVGSIIFGDVPGGEEAFETLTVRDPSPHTLKQRKVMEYIIARVLSHDGSDSDALRLIVHGPGGSGKSFVLRAVAQRLREAEKGVVIAAATGAAAFQAGGVTLHSALGLPVVNRSYGVSTVDVPPPQGARLEKLKELWRYVSLLIIDELSLCSREMLRRISRHLQHIRPHRANLPFGGLNIVMCGDLYQLPPVLDFPMYNDLYTFRMFELVELEGNHRAARDPEWAALLGRVRVGAHTKGDIATLKSRVKARVPDEAVRLRGTRAGVASLNQQLFDRHIRIGGLDKDIFDCPAQDVYDNQQLEASPASNAFPSPEDTGGLQNLFQVALGCRVMLRINLDVTMGLVNGACGWVDSVPC